MANIQTRKDKKVIIIPIAVALIILAIILSLTKCDNQKEVYVPATQSTATTSSQSAPEPIWVPAPVTEPEPAVTPTADQEKPFEPVPALTTEEENDAFVKYGPEK